MFPEFVVVSCADDDLCTLQSMYCYNQIFDAHKVMTIWMQYISFNHFDADNSVLAKQKTNPEWVWS